MRTRNWAKAPECGIVSKLGDGLTVMTSRQKIWFISLALCTSVPFPAVAETLEDLDAMVAASTDEKTGISFAREQAARGEILDAISTLERVLTLHPKSPSARLLHAIFICDIDDKQGGTVELGKLKKKQHAEQSWNVATARCSMNRGS